MSSRQLRKLRKQDDILNLQHEGQQDSESEQDQPLHTMPRTNPFSGFAALSQGGDDSAEEQASPVEEVPQQPSTTDQPTTKSKKSKKKKKSKKSQTVSDGSNQKLANVASPDEIDQALRELSLSRPAQTGTDAVAPEYSHDLERLLRINSQHLKVMNEMRAVFGRDTIEAAQALDPSPATQQPRHGEEGVDLETFLREIPSARTQGKKMPEVLIRRNPFIQWKDTWPAAPAGGLTMKCLKDGNQGISEFTFAHENAYVQTEAEFFSYVQTHDSQRMVMFLKVCPYHVSSLIQVSKIAKHQDRNTALSADLCERALFTLGRVTLSTFRKKLEEGRARMDFRRPENRQFLLAGYLYIQTLITKGTYRTALEWIKLFLSLSSTDEYALMTFGHALAVRAHEAEWFIDYCNSEVFSQNPSPMRSYFKQTIALAKLQMKDVEGARAALEEGIQTLPWLYGALFSAMNLDTPKAIWGIQPRDTNEELYTNLYVQTAKDLWNNSQAISLLKGVANITTKPDTKSLPKAEDVTLSIARFVYLENTPTLMAMIPSNLLHTNPNFDFDPLPPPEEENIFSNNVQKLPWAESSTTIPGLGNLERSRLEALDPERRGALERLMGLIWPGAAGSDGEVDPETGYRRWAGGSDGSDLDLDEDHIREFEDEGDDMPDLEPID